MKLSLLLLVGLAVSASAQTIVSVYPGPVASPAVVIVDSNEVAQVIGAVGTFDLSCRLDLPNGQNVMFYLGSQFPSPALQGPFTATWTSSQSTLVTIRKTPITPLGSTVIVPAGTGARMVVESSGDLITWTNTPGVISNAPAALFFRIRAERF